MTKPIEVEEDTRPQAWLIRHGATEWSASGRHTGRTDVPLIDEGRAQARRLSERLGRRRFAIVLCSPLSRALDTARLAGYPDVVIEPDLREWHYGAYEGLTTQQIRESVPGWTVWTHRVVDGETADEVAARVDRVIARVRGAAGNVALFAHGHVLRVLAARWLDLPPTEGRRFALATATVSVLGWERETPVVERWNSPADGA
ncbi:MAG TPA: histidine phosphatase family protein [Candidatus Limnocylindrales bacterium]|nr:histidine phosphatase family protein [Candidatus Limnocylindrales bacterium]